MFFPAISGRLASRRHTRPVLEGLEDRKLLYATLGGSFVYGSRITYSFAPDGTDIGGVPSNLFQTMAIRGFTTSQWEGAFQKAAAAWEAASNVNLVLVSDDGSYFGAAGKQQGDSRFGDVRIGGMSLSPNVLATCFLPPAFNGGTLAGDMVINTTQSWQINNDYDLQTVGIHEFGHALGLDHSALSTADMYSIYNSQKQSLTSDDISGIQAVYGTRQADSYDAAASNNTSARASDLTSLINTNAQATVSSLDLTNSTDIDWYSVTAPANASGTLTVSMQSTNLSSLSPKILVYNGSLAGLTSASAANTFGATVTATVTGVTAGQKYYFKCMAANGGTTAIGAYGLLVNFGTGTMSPVAPPNTTVASQPDQGTGSANEMGMITIGSLLGEGDNLSIDRSYQQAINLVNSGWVTAGTFTDPLETFTIQILATIGHNASTTTSSGLAARSAAIRAIDYLLNHWEK